MPRMPEPAAPTAPASGLVAPTGLASPAPGLVVGGLVATRPAGPTQPAPGTSPFSAIRAQSTWHTIPELAGSDFVVLDEPRKQTVGILYARDGHGKTFWGCAYCPEPIVLIGLDGRGERTAKQVMLETGRKIYYLDAKAPGNAVQMSHEQAQQAGTDAVTTITRNYEWAIEKSIREWGRGTMIFDTSSELRDIVRLSVRGRVDRPMPKKGERSDFGQSDAVINRTLKYFCDRARDSNLNLILLARSKPVYEGREDTGRVTFDTDKIFVQAADWIVGLNMVSNAPVGMAVGGGAGMTMLGAGMGIGGNGTGLMKPSFELQVTNPKCAYEETGKVYREADWQAAGENPFVYSMQRLIPGSTAGDWR